MRYYTIESLEKAYHQEHPDFSEKMIKEKARDLHKSLNTLDMYWKRSNRRFLRYNELV